jgi:hypothetical protein
MDEVGPMNPAPGAPAIGADALSPQLRKHVDPGAPVALRAMAAKLLVPMGPHDAACTLYLLSFDPDETVREAAAKSAVALPERLAGPTLRDEGIPPPVLGWFAERLVQAGNDRLLEFVILNPSTPDEALVEVVRRGSPEVVELVAQNQLRFLRCDPLLRAILSESRASPAVIDGTADFAIRSGVYFDDVPALVEAHRRIHGDKPPEPPGETAEEVLRELRQDLYEEPAEGVTVDEGRRLTLTQRIQKMNVSERIKLATRGNKEARTILLRDSNKLVAVAAVQSPRITDGEVIALTNSRTILEDVLRVIINNRDWMKLYQVKLNLVKNPKTPLPTALKLLPHIRASDLKDLMKNKNVPTAVQTGARNQYSKSQPR